jgi:hypothetical protein
MTNVAQYNADAVQAAIDQDKTISKKQGQLIHALLKGRTRPEPKPGERCGACSGQTMPGVLYPALTAGEKAPDNWDFVERCDACGVYESDEDASYALAHRLDSEVRHYRVHALDRTQPAIAAREERRCRDCWGAPECVCP